MAKKVKLFEDFYYQIAIREHFSGKFELSAQAFWVCSFFTQFEKGNSPTLSAFGCEIPTLLHYHHHLSVVRPSTIHPFSRIK